MNDPAASSDEPIACGAPTRSMNAGQSWNGTHWGACEGRTHYA